MGEGARSTFGRYEALFRLGAGGMAWVHLARIRGEAGFERLVAVKQMLPDLASDERFVDMFLDEARVAAHIQSPHVVSTLDLGRTTDGALYIVMELVVGVALGSLLGRTVESKRRVPVRVAAEIVAQAAQGLHDAHEATTSTGKPLRIVHRDVSPRNVLVGADGRVRITDFGVAHALQRRSVTRPGQLKGTLSYLSPEQVAGKAVDRRSDVFSLGVVAWETLAGKRLFRGSRSRLALDDILTMPIPDLGELRDDLPDDVRAAVMMALERTPDARWQTAADLASALRRAAGLTDPTAAQREVSRFVEDVAGEEVEKLRHRIEEDASEPEDGRSRDDGAETLPEISSPATPSDSGWQEPRSAPTESLSGEPRERPGYDVHAAPTLLAVGAIDEARADEVLREARGAAEAPRRRRSGARWWVAVGATLVLGGASAWLVAHTLSAVPAPAGRPAVDPEDGTVSATETEAATEAATATATATETEAVSETEAATETATDAVAVSVTATGTATEAGTVSATEAVAVSATATGTATEAAAAPERAATAPGALTDRRHRPASTRPAVPEPRAGEPPARLLGVDAFDQQVER